MVEPKCIRAGRPSRRPLPPSRYLPGARLPDNIVAVPDLEAAVDGADVLIICAPHQFVRGICKQLQASGKVSATVPQWGNQRGPDHTHVFFGIDWFSIRLAWNGKCFFPREVSLIDWGRIERSILCL